MRKDIKPIWKEGDIQNPISDDHRVQLEYLQVIEKLTAEHDMHDQVRAKLYKTIGYLYAVQRNYAGALAMLTRALELDKNCGVKKDIERLQPKAASAYDPAHALHPSTPKALLSAPILLSAVGEVGSRLKFYPASHHHCAPVLFLCRYRLTRLGGKKKQNQKLKTRLIRTAIRCCCLITSKE